MRRLLMQEGQVGARSTSISPLGVPFPVAHAPFQFSATMRASVGVNALVLLLVTVLGGRARCARWTGRHDDFMPQDDTPERWAGENGSRRADATRSGAAIRSYGGIEQNE